MVSDPLEGLSGGYDRRAAAHSTRVARASAAVARRLGLSDPAVETTLWIAALHDLGEFGVPAEVLGKPGPLDEVEWSAIRRHSALGSDLLLATSASLASIAAAVRAHHEQWDGSGYPDQLAGEDIPVLGRVVAIADAFDAMTHRRPYRDTVRTAAGAVGELQHRSGSQFDPNLVPVFVELCHRGEITID